MFGADTHLLFNRRRPSCEVINVTCLLQGTLIDYVKSLNLKFTAKRAMILQDIAIGIELV